MFTGYIDESGNNTSKLFTLSCLVGFGSQWFWFENAWANCLEKKNKQLKAEGRPELSRYHASDCSCLKNEFEGWTQAEQIEFTQWLLRIFMRHPLVVVSYTVDLKDVVAEIPEAEEDPYGLAYVLLLNNLMVQIGSRILADPRYKTDCIALVHDRSDYDAVLREAFNHMKNDLTFEFRDRFTTIEPASSQECILLQAADLLAYENFKVAERESAGHKRRKVMEALLDLDSFGGCGIKLTRDGIREIKGKLDEESTRILFENARIRGTSRANTKAAKPKNWEG